VWSLCPPPLALLPRDDGTPVLVLPGFTADDRSTSLLRRSLDGHGFSVFGWSLGRNLGPTATVVDGMRSIVILLSRTHGRPVALVGVSLGGIYARVLARELPGRVSQVITLGSPYRLRPRDRTSVQLLWERLEPYHDGDMPINADHAAAPLEVPVASVYTRADGVVPWEACVEQTGAGAPNPRAENIEVYGSHTGMSFNASVLYAVVDRLVNLRREWRPFRPPLPIRAWYPPAVVSPAPLR
jgi:pimeloyl-ACP methyl ester carboxylesterase